MPVIIKTIEQIEGVRAACKLAARTLEFVAEHIQPGITTLEIDKLVDGFTRDHGAIPAPLGYRGFPKSVCTSINEVVCHGIPDETILKEGDIINVDVTPILNGFYGDTSKMFAIGQISDDAQKLLTVTKQCLDAGIQVVKPGNRTGLIGYQISKWASNFDYSVVEQFGGHGVGIAFHEDPYISHKSHPSEGIVMQPGMIFTIEPMICQGTANTRILNDGWTAVTLDKKLSAQYEHTVLVTEEGVEILTLRNEENET